MATGKGLPSGPPGRDYPEGMPQPLTLEPLSLQQQQELTRLGGKGRGLEKPSRTLPTLSLCCQDSCWERGK